jgi:putative NADPH-quinone reductase
MSKVLVYYAHPGQNNSRVNSQMVTRAQQIEGITFVDLYAEYPRFQIDHVVEQERLAEHDVIIFQHPIHWYSTPALLKEFVDRVFDLGFAYGIGGDKLKGKRLLQAVSAGAPKEAYSTNGYQNFPLRTF